MEMTTPVFTRRTNTDGEKMDMTTPVITRKVKFSLVYLLSSFVDMPFSNNIVCCIVKALTDLKNDD